MRNETSIGDFCEITKRPCEKPSCENCELIYREDGSGD
jgi:hypothetical protein